MDDGHCDPPLDALGNGAGLQFSWGHLLFPLVCPLLDRLVWWWQEGEVWREMGSAVHTVILNQGLWEWFCAEGPREASAPCAPVI